MKFDYSIFRKNLVQTVNLYRPAVYIAKVIEDVRAPDSGLYNKDISCIYVSNRLA